MGKGKGDKQTSTNEPWAESKPYLLGAANTLQGAYNQSAGGSADIQNAAKQALPGATGQAVNGNPALNAGTGYNIDVLGGKYLGQGNPYLQSQIDNTNNDVRNQVQASLGTHGLTGGSDYANMIAKTLAQNETGLRYGDYSNERSLMGQAAGQTSGQAIANNAQYQGLGSLLGLYNAPLSTAGQYAGSLGGLLGGYQSKTDEKKPGLLSTLGTVGDVAASILPFIPGISDRRLKTDIKRVGQTDEGLPLYVWRYKGSNIPHMGPMAQDVEVMQPHALGPEIGGYKTVRYEELR